MTDTDFRVALLAGAAAGTSVDVSLFPLDTIKTRLQSHAGFWKSGGFRGIYSGLLSVTIGSAPTAAVFFCTYETTKNFASSVGLSKSFPIVHMAGASFGEVTCCLIRVPVEVIKQRAQVFTNTSSYSVLRNTLQSEILWSREQGKPVDPWQSSVCGAVAGSIASGITTPLDVAKTRIMLAEKNSALASGSIPHAIKIIFLEKGVKGLFAGIIPRVIWISIGGAIFLGVYEKVKLICNKHFTEKGYL
ncbi:S-adenosylmethionine mitochondrial carrier protein-like isoform X2 [Mytilus californianus]|uniref:S-adenosylmethionine mitochondrial carrier protein-like isoform X2 n=1 Tax=Mytilus californianus TaxID=6549 RepID=UPI0022460860|nr:S-adenosylmethionine mitochondrial carrier protein-like isoform X2 [Mytilus californianus]